MRNFKILLIMVIFSQVLQAGVKEIKSFEARFVQIIINPNGKKLQYRGIFFAKHNNLALWNYSKPIKKIIYYFNNRVTIVEPELEQVIITPIQKKQNLIKIMNSAKEVSKNRFVATCCGVKYSIYTKDKKGIDRIEYRDKLDNKNIIKFYAQQVNQKLEDEMFEPNIPEDFDIIER